MVSGAGSRSQRISKGPLKDKVALLYNGANAGGRSLVLSLARNGADVAIVYRQVHVGRARETKKLVEAEGRRCLIIPAQKANSTFPRELVRKTIGALGRLDIFIDCSSRPRDQIGPADRADTVELLENIDQTRPFTNVEFILAALDQMVGPGGTTTQVDDNVRK